MKCLDCGNPAMLLATGDYAFVYDRGSEITLRGMTMHWCNCGYSEIEIPKLGPLIATIDQVLSILRVDRDRLAFFFTPGPVGIQDGTWGVIVSLTRRPPTDGTLFGSPSVPAKKTRKKRS